MAKQTTATTAVQRWMVMGMAKCIDCLHYEACSGFKPTDLDKDVWHYCEMGIPEEIPDIDQRCDSFKDSKSWVEVVRCKDCKLWVEGRHHTGRCNALIQFHDAERYVTDEGHFCSYRERKTVSTSP